MRVILFATAMTAAVSAAIYSKEHYEGLFYDHLKKYNIVFKNGAEFIDRLHTFTSNVDNIALHNACANRTYSLGINRFTHLTFDEFKTEVGIGGLTRGDMSPRGNIRKGWNPAPPAPALETLPKSVDWVAAGAVTPVKNQGKCGSCWSFSTTGAIEGAYFNKWGTLASFSEQELVSCDTTDNNCNGGWMDAAFEWIKNNGGLAYEADYPYVSGDGTTIPACGKSAAYQDPKAAPSSWVDVPRRSMTGLMSAVAQQPVSIAIQADQAAFQSYSGGVLTGRCGTKLDHGVLLVGYGTSADGIDYWKVKNSWGPDWGMDGYILIERSSADLCGVMDAASYPVL